METDYPWSKLGSATVVDVGGGVGKLSTLFLNFHWTQVGFFTPVLAH